MRALLIWKSGILKKPAAFLLILQNSFSPIALPFSPQSQAGDFFHLDFLEGTGCKRRTSHLGHCATSALCLFVFVML
jgi:hypothetical protein